MILEGERREFSLSEILNCSIQCDRLPFISHSSHSAFTSADAGHVVARCMRSELLFFPENFSFKAPMFELARIANLINTAIRLQSTLLLHILTGLTRPRF